MKIESRLTDRAILAELGRRLADTRLTRNVLQEDLAREAGVGPATIRRLESGHSVATRSLMRVLRALELLDDLDRGLPVPAPSPIEQLKLRGSRRRRASRNARATVEREDGPWSWADREDVE